MFRVEEAEVAVDAFLAKKTPISLGLRHLIREVQDFVPRAGTTSRELSLHILHTNRHNFICLYHQHHRSPNYLSDGVVPGKSHTLRGIPYPRIVTSSKGESQAPPEGHLHCGCNVDVALLDLFWWKTWILHSTRPNLPVSERLGDEYLPPHVRAFFAQAFIEATGLMIDDLYTSGVGTSGYNTMNMRMYQLRRMLQLVNGLDVRDGAPQLTIQALDPNHEK